MRLTLRRGNDQVITLPRLRVVETLIFLNTAIVKATLTDSRDRVVPGFEDIPLSYVNNSDGTYIWNIDGPTLMIPKGLYSLAVRAVEGDLDFRVVYEVSVED